MKILLMVCAIIAALAALIWAALALEAFAKADPIAAGSDAALAIVSFAGFVICAFGCAVLGRLDTLCDRLSRPVAADRVDEFDRTLREMKKSGHLSPVQTGTS